MTLAIGKFMVATVIGIAIECCVNAQTKVGDKKNGGIVFFVDGTGQHGLIADVKDLGKFDWNNAIIACKNKGAGWYLPSKDELNMLYQNKDKVGSFEIVFYWSSSEVGNVYGDDSAWGQDFFTGFQLVVGFKGNAGFVRTVRAF